MITCPYCQHPELIGSLYCNECGADLILSQAEINRGIGNRKNQDELQNPEGPNAEPVPIAAPNLKIYLYLSDEGQPLSLSGAAEYILGRASEDQPLLPDIDLAAFKAFEKGVSRLHASIRVQGNQLFMVDLNSANGTMINGKRIPSYLPQLIQNGDRISLGKLQIRIQVES